VPAPVINYSGAHEFDLEPRALWDAIERFDTFGRWWSWLKEFRMEGDGLAAGSVLYGVVAPPVPYRMRVRVEIIDAVRDHSIEAVVHGDLEGVAHILMRPSATGSGTIGTRVEIDWTVEMMQAPMRLASRFAYPLLRFGHDRVVEATITSFRRHVEMQQR
jgi:carbon monoxide dehydrogenase subunit G